MKGRLAGHYYYGKHTTNKLNDNYIGSGKILTSYYKKYGKIEGETYIKEIIQFYNSIEELNKAEYELIGDKWKTDPLCLNLKQGGEGGNGHVNKGKEPWNKGKKTPEEVKIKQSIAHIGVQSGEKHPNYGKHRKNETCEKISNSLKGHPAANKGVSPSDESKEKNRQAHLGKHRVWNEEHTKYKYN